MPGIDDPIYSLTLVGNNILNTMQTLLGFRALTTAQKDGKKWGSVLITVDGFHIYLQAWIIHLTGEAGTAAKPFFGMRWNRMQEFLFP